MNLLERCLFLILCKGCPRVSASLQLCPRRSWLCVWGGSRRTSRESRQGELGEETELCRLFCSSQNSFRRIFKEDFIWTAPWDREGGDVCKREARRVEPKSQPREASGSHLCLEGMTALPVCPPPFAHISQGEKNRKAKFLISSSLRLLGGEGLYSLPLQRWGMHSF